MAKFGEGDPRWIVDHRDDGKNVNGWHWEEKSILGQVKARMSDVFSNMQLDMGGKQGEITITACSALTGEAALNTRKAGKKLVIYDLTMTLDYTAKLAGSDAEVTGTVKVSEFATGSEADDLVWEFTGSDEAKRAVELIGKPQITARLEQLASEMANLA